MVLVSAATVLSACGGGSSRSSPHTTPTTSATPAVQGLSVDLTITGAANLAIHGTRGSCSIPTNGAPATYTVSATDYPQLGPSGSIRIFGATTVPGRGDVAPNIVAYINGNGFVSPINGAGVNPSANQHSVQIDAALSSSSGSSPEILQNPQTQLNAHITGTVRCI